MSTPEKLQSSLFFPSCFGYHGNLLIVKGSGSWVGKKSTCNAGNPGSIPGWRRSHGEGIGYPLQYSWASLVAQLVRIFLQCRRPGFHPWVPLQYSWASLVAQLVRIFLQCRRPGFHPWVGKMPWRREQLPIPVFWPGEFHQLRNLEGYSLRGCKESDTTERLSLSKAESQKLVYWG